MKIAASLLALAFAASACQTSPYRSYGDRPTINDNTLMSVPVAKRDDINKARTEHAEMVDRVALAKRDVDEAQERVKLAKQEVSIANAEISAAESRLELARKRVDTDRDDGIKTATENLDGVRAHLRWARTNVILAEERVEQKQAQVELAEERVDLAQARIELAKASAVKDLERDDFDDIDVHDFQRSVADAEVSVRLAEIDIEAWEKKIEARKSSVDESAKLVPASYRKGWRETDEVKSNS